MNNNGVDLWEAACYGDLDTLKNYYENGGETGYRYFAFGKNNSLIAGAYRNGNYDVVRYLISRGEAIEDHEKHEIDFTMMEAIETIARNYLHIETLEGRHSDELDFYDLAVWNIKSALEAAYIAGCNSK